MSESENPLVAFSAALVDAVNRAGAATVLVNARKRLPASGVIFEADLVITADHVIERDAEIKIMLEDGREVKASLAGRDPASDLAVLRLDQAASQIAVQAPADGRVGQLVLALGRPSSNGIEASLGVISTIGGPARTHRGGLLERFLRTDTIPYPGFSGGPLVDASGQVLGINTSGLTPGAAITIPASVAWTVGKTLAQHGHLRRGYLGIRSQPVELPDGASSTLGRSQTVGLLLVGIEQNSPAAAAGLMVGDILVGINQHPVDDPDELISHLSGEIVGQQAPIEILRAGQPQVVQVVVGERK